MHILEPPPIILKAKEIGHPQVNIVNNAPMLQLNNFFLAMSMNYQAWTLTEKLVVVTLYSYFPILLDHTVRIACKLGLAKKIGI